MTADDLRLEYERCAKIAAAFKAKTQRYQSAIRLIERAAVGLSMYECRVGAVLERLEASRDAAEKMADHWDNRRTEALIANLSGSFRVSDDAAPPHAA